MVQRGRGFQSALQHRIREAIIKIQALLVDRPPALGHHPGPAGGKSIGVKPRRSHKIQILLKAVIVVTGQLPMLSAHDISRGGGKTIPMGEPGPTLGMPFNLVGRCGRSK